MRIAQVSPLHESVPPKLYGGTERVVSYLTEELVRQGHDVTLFASGDSETKARLIPCSPQSLRLDDNCVDPLAHHLVMVDRVFEMAHLFDIIHFHIDYLHFPLAKRYEVPNIATMHGRMDIPDLLPVFRRFPLMKLVSISDAQREPLPWANWQGTVYHGLPENLYRFRENPQGYLAFLGRVSPEKGLDSAIEIAKRSGMPLKIAAKVSKEDNDYYEQQIKPLLDDALIEFVGEIGEQDKEEFLGNAQALLFPINWREPFGLVMIEAMACGTPVVAFPAGSVPEIITDGVNGFLCTDVDEAVEAVKRIPSLGRSNCRREFEERFSAARMAKDYVKLYERVARQDRVDMAAPLVKSTISTLQAPLSHLHG